MATSDSNSGEERRHPGTPQIMRNVFGVFMIIIYIGMGILLLMNFFQWPDTTAWQWGRYAAAALFMLYGVWRGIRQFKGIDSSI